MDMHMTGDFQTLALTKADIQAVLDKHMPNLPEADQQVMLAGVGSLMTLAGVAGAPVEHASFAAALRVVADILDTYRPQMVAMKQMAKLQPGTASGVQH